MNEYRYLGMTAPKYRIFSDPILSLGGEVMKVFEI